MHATGRLRTMAACVYLAVGSFEAYTQPAFVASQEHCRVLSFVCLWICIACFASLLFRGARQKDKEVAKEKQKEKTLKRSVCKH